jgi:cellulose synthase/poly-beta-1,6-N-acetylglucosamine synthase-like glycosyltransferase
MNESAWSSLPRDARRAAFFREAGIGQSQLAFAERRAQAFNTDLCSELCAAFRGAEEALFEVFAAGVGSAFLREIEPARIVSGWEGPGGLSAGLPFAHYEDGIGAAKLLLAPSPEKLLSLIEADTDLAAVPNTRITTPTALRNALEVKHSAFNLHHAIYDLATRNPAQSSRFALHGWQAWFAGVLIGLSPVIVAFQADALMVVLQVCVLVFFAACASLRLLAAWSGLNRGREPAAVENPDHWPTYTVLVAAYREAAVAGQLIEQIARLQWPRSKLDVLIACESDDPETLAAFKRLDPPPYIRLVEVPPGGPRTKPKALMYALALVKSQCLVIFDAEDRPHPRQLIEASAAFDFHGPRLACVQAPLQISNGNTNLLTRLFAFEYDALFRGLLPFLGRRGLFLPLGGTSNHFRVSALREVGGWDPFNVTEDADLGLRLHAAGFRTTTITLPTLEDAPEQFGVWLRQRTRWFKGYIQTWMVSLRRPRLMIGRVGLVSYLALQTLLGGLVVSSLAHGLLVLLIALSAVWTVAAPPGAPMPQGLKPIAILDAVFLAFGYLAFFLLGVVSASKATLSDTLKCLAGIPVYWMLLTLAAWRAAFQFLRDPHLCGLMYQTHQGCGR